MSAVTLSACPPAMRTSGTSPTTTAYIIPDALQQFLSRVEDQRNVNLLVSESLCSLKADLESRWQIASSEGYTSSTMLYQILEYGWKEWRRIIA